MTNLQRAIWSFIAALSLVAVCETIGVLIYRYPWHMTVIIIGAATGILYWLLWRLEQEDEQ